MRNLSIITLIIISALATTASAQSTRVEGHFRSNGQYVQPHYRTTPNKTTFDNYSTKGNSNLYTGKKGYSDPYKPKSSWKGK